MARKPRRFLNDVAEALTSAQAKVHVNLSSHRHRLAVLGGRLESPGLDGSNGAGIQSRVERSGDLDVVRALIRAHNNSQSHRAFDLRVFRFVRVLGLAFSPGPSAARFRVQSCRSSRRTRRLSSAPEAAESQWRFCAWHRLFPAVRTNVQDARAVWSEAFMAQPSRSELEHSRATSSSTFA